MNKKAFFISPILILIGVFAFAIFFDSEVLNYSSELGITCEDFGGDWVADYSECEFLSEDYCSLMGGEFFECESACRHELEPGPCVLMCIPVCKIEPVSIRNPASEFCIKSGGDLKFRDTEGKIITYCVFTDGTELEEWEYFRLYN